MSESQVKTRPFLKWPGGKFRLLPKILPKLPKGEVLIEPFVGAGAIFLNTNYDFYYLCDINPDLINLYKILQSEGKSAIGELKKYFHPRYNSEKKYYQVRELFNNSECHFERSTLFLYLNRHGYNGLCRYNRSGIYNVPFGSYKKPYFPEQELLNFCQKAKRAKFLCADFQQTKSIFSKLEGKKTVIYCDPPYAPISPTAKFTNYAPTSFLENNQILLAKFAKNAARKGIPVLISNNDTSFTNEIYQGAQITKIRAPRLISCKTQNRSQVSELLALFEST